MLTKIIKNKYKLIELTTIFVLTLLYSLICINLSGDETWNYGFTYNIATGLIPYKDFNMVITPLFPILGALFLNIFGKNILVFHIFNAIICTLIFHHMKKFVPQNCYILYTVLLTYCLPSYNLFCVLLLYIVMNLENKKSNDYLTGIVLGLIFLTKQNIGIYLCLPTLFIKDIRRIFKRGIGFIIPNIIILVYLLINNCLYEFIDYAFLGINSFAKDNLIVSYPHLITVAIIILYLIYQYIKKKDLNIIYLLCFQLIIFPLIDNYHVIIGLIPSIGYILSTIKLSKKVIFAWFISFIITIFSMNIYGIYKGQHIIPNNTNEYKYRKLMLNDDIVITNIANYINNADGDIYILSKLAYLYKLESNLPINKYDLLNNGNLGSGGPAKIINEIQDNCSKNKCVFLIDERDFNNNPKVLYNQDVIRYVIDNYKENGMVQGLVIYKNY